MKLTKLYFENYKAFAGEHELELRPLTILIGRNNSGKSALARLPLLLRELCVDTDGADLLRPPGGQFHAMFHGQHDVGDMSLGWQLDTMEEPLTLAYELLRTRGEHQVNLRELRAGALALKPDADSRDMWSIKDSTMRYGAIQIARNALSRWRFVTARRDAIVSELLNAHPEGGTGGDLMSPEARAAEDKIKPLHDALEASGASWPQLQRFDALRERPARGARHVERDEMEHLYDWAASRLYEYKTDKSPIFDDIQAWYLKHLNVMDDAPQGGGYYLDVKLEKRGLEVMFKHEQYAHPVHLVDSGAGIGQSLPIVVYCHMLIHEAKRLEVADRPRQSELLIVEEPESHLHPGVHGALAEIFIKLIKESNHRAIVETHSEVFCLRMQRRIAEKKLSPDDVVIYWVDQNPKLGRASITPIFISEKGETYIWRDRKRIRYWPRGVFSEDFEEIQAIQELANI